MSLALAPDAVKIDSIPMSEALPEGVMEISFTFGNAAVGDVMGKDNKRRYFMAQAKHDAMRSFWSVQAVSTVAKANMGLTYIKVKVEITLTLHSDITIRCGSAKSLSWRAHLS